MEAQRGKMFGLLFALIGFILGFLLALNYVAEKPSAAIETAALVTKNTISETDIALPSIPAIPKRSPPPRSIEDIMLLATEFQQTTALYSAAEQADLQTVTQLIFQAAKIADLSDRKGALSILFSRLVEINPESAIEISGQARFKNYQGIERSIWRGWARSDFTKALAAANRLEDQARKEMAAQVMYYAYGVYNDYETTQIEEVLNIKPNRWAKRHYMLSLVEHSVASAFEFTNSVRPPKDQRYVAKRLGLYLGNEQSESALGYSEMLTSIPSRQQYSKAVLEAVASSEPHLILSRWLNNKNDPRNRDSVSTAFYQLALSDIDEAQQFLDKLDDQKMKQSLSQTFVSIKGLSDPSGVLSWAQNANGGRKFMFSVVQELAKINPLDTFDVINELPFSEEKVVYIAAAIGELTKVDVQSAINKINEISDAKDREIANAFMLKEWINLDTEAAIEYAVENHENINRRALGKFSEVITGIDPYTVIGYLPKLDEGTAQFWRQTMITTMLKERSFPYIESFLLKNSHVPKYTEIQAEIVSQLVYKNVEQALSVAINMNPGSEKDAVFSKVVSNLSRTDPRLASTLVNSISDSQMRSQTVNTLTYYWREKDSAAARSWVISLPSGKEKDNALASLISANNENNDVDIGLIDSMEDQTIRQGTMFNKLVQIAETDQQTAQDMAVNADINESQLRRFNYLIKDCFGENATEESKRLSCGNAYDY